MLWRRSRGRLAPAALEYAELVDSPAHVVALAISILVLDPADEGSLRHNVSYEKPSVPGAPSREALSGTRELHSCSHPVH